MTLHGAPGDSHLGEDDDAPEQEGALAFLRAGRAEAALLARLSSALRVSRLHALDNVAARETLEELREGLTRFITLRERALVLVGEGRRVYVNGRMVRSGKASGTWLEDLADLLERAGAGGLLLAGAWDGPAVRDLVAAFAPPPGASGPAARLEALRAGLGRIGAPAQAQAFDPAGAQALAQEEEEGYASESHRAAYYFARLVALAEAGYAAARAGRAPDVHTRHVRQTLMKVVDALDDPLFEARLIGCGVLEPSGGDPVALHAARVAVLALVMGRLLGLPRGSVGDLGFAALFHDLGRVDAAHQADPAGDREARAGLEEHVVAGVRAALRGRTYATSGLLRLVVGFEHHRVADDAPAEAVLREPHAFSQLVAVADAFDRLEHGLPWRAPVSPAEALQTLAAEPERYEPAIVELLIDALGRTPRGTLLQLRSGDVVVVVAGGARQGHRPIVRRLQLATGAPDPARSLAVLDGLGLVAAELDPDVRDDWRDAVLV
ncbi:MAG: hypothetical protein M9894_05865 [Planctomycetes bacterium]|nr:hypothetical protein [Planctomycetota bacterium]